MNINKLMKQAQQMQEKLKSDMAELKVDAAAGGGMVEVTMSGNKEVLSVKISPEIVSPDDVEMLQDLVLAAVNEASRKVDDHLAQQLGGIPGMPKGMF